MISESISPSQGAKGEEAMQVDDKVLTKHGHQGTYYGSIINKVNADGTFDITYDDRDEERSVSPDRIHRTQDTGKQFPSPLLAAEFV